MRAGWSRDADQLVGRDAALTTLARTHGSLAERSAATFVVGDPGMGKSAIWTVAVGRALESGTTVLTARPAEAEHGSPWSCFADLLAPVPTEVLDRLPVPQRHAVDAVCLREESVGGQIDPRAVWTALRTVVSVLAEDAPVMLAIDDVHWIDVASVRGLASLCRRLPDRGVWMLATSRPTIDGPAHELATLAGADRIDLGPMTSADTAAAVRRHLGVVLSGPALERVHTAAGGNPMFAIELARAGAHRAGRPPVVPLSLRQLVTTRVEATSAEVRLTLAALAAARLTSAQLAAAGLDAGLADAERAELARIDASGPSPSHPLVGAAAYAACDAATRRHIHAHLAEVVDNEYQRAHHAALGATVAGADTLAALDAAAASAAARGAADAAAELLTLALELTPTDDANHWPRHLAAGEHRFHSGDSALARPHFQRVLDEASDRAMRARAAIRMAELSWETEPAEVAARHATFACRLSAGDAELTAEAEVTLARVLSVVDLEGSAAAASRALAVLDRLGDRANHELLAAALVAGATADFRIGRGLDRDRFARAIALERRHPPARVADRAEAVLASMLRFTDDIDGAGAALASVQAAIDREGDESSLPFVFGKLVPIEFWAGRWDDAMRIAHEHLQLAERTGQAAQRRHAEYGIAMVTSRRGDDATTAPIAAQLAAWGRAEGDSWTEMTAENILGFVAYTRGEHDLAVEHFEIAYGIAESMSLREPGCIRIRADHVESLVALGERKRAETLLDEYEALALAVDRATPLAAVARCRALIAASNGDLAAAVEAATESLRQYGRVQPGTFAFERARTLLVVGQLHRRLRHKREARAALAEARDVFQRLRSHRFVGFADAELARLGQRPHEPAGLTATEQRVAELAAQGLTTRQVADAVFLSPKTVEANLTRAYRKLGVKSRAELGAWLARQSSAG